MELLKDIWSIHQHIDSLLNTEFPRIQFKYRNSRNVTMGTSGLVGMPGTVGGIGITGTTGHVGFKGHTHMQSVKNKLKTYKNM